MVKRRAFYRVIIMATVGAVLSLLALSCNKTVETTYTLTVTAVNGTVTKSPDKASYTSGETVTLTAVANGGYVFSAWSGDATGASATTTVTMDANKTVTATFTVETTCTLTVTAVNGTVTKSPDKASYTSGETVTLTAVANGGYVFSAWSGDATGASATTTVTMDANKTVTATFAVMKCEDVLPVNGDYSTWVLLGLPKKVETTTEFFAWVDGYALPYTNRGWVRAVVQKYTNVTDSFSIEVYDQGNADSATSLYNHFGASAPDSALPGYALDTAYIYINTFAGLYNVLYHKDRFYIRVMNVSLLSDPNKLLGKAFVDIMQAKLE